MPGRFVGIALVTTLLTFLAFALWYQQAHPRMITGTGQISVESRRPPYQSLTLKTRDVSINAVAFKEVQLPGGSWLDCAGDCRQAARAASTDFWEAQDVKRK
jgi:hypothetical protein